MNENPKGTSNNIWLCAALGFGVLAFAMAMYGNSPTTSNNNLKSTAEPAPVVVAHPTTIQTTIKMVTPADYAAELDTSNNVLIQLCLPEQCAADRAVLERVGPSFSNVKFVQMSTADNTEFAGRLKAENEASIKKNSSIKPLAYPVYIYKGADLNIAPVTSEEELRKFIETNLSADAPEVETIEPKQ